MGLKTNAEPGGFAEQSVLQGLSEYRLRREGEFKPFGIEAL